jgi:hypothetical protein
LLLDVVVVPPTTFFVVVVFAVVVAFVVAAVETGSGLYVVPSSDGGQSVGPYSRITITITNKKSTEIALSTNRGKRIDRQFAPPISSCIATGGTQTSGIVARTCTTGNVVGQRALVLTASSRATCRR